MTEEQKKRLEEIRKDIYESVVIEPETWFGYVEECLTLIDEQAAEVERLVVFAGEVEQDNQRLRSAMTLCSGSCRNALEGEDGA